MEASLRPRHRHTLSATDREHLPRALAPALFVLPYPAFVDGFHWAVGGTGTVVPAWGILVAGLFLMLMFAVPAFGFASIFMVPIVPNVSHSFEVRARRLSYVTIVAPTLYCFVGVNKYLLGNPLPDELTWLIIWGMVIGYFIFVPLHDRKETPLQAWLWLRTTHGITALIVIAFVAFHLSNHLVAWNGELAHAALMDAGRKIYRSSLGEPLLVAAMAFQAVTGLTLAWRWSAPRCDFHRAFQVSSGLFLAVYIIGHMNSVFVFARGFMGIPTGWNFATSAPNGLIHDPWSVRLIPHYALGVFFVIAHLFSGLRVVMMAHGSKERLATQIWQAGTAFAAFLSTAIMLAMCGLRST